MKKITALTLSIGIIIFFIASYNNKLNYKEDILYSEKNLTGFVKEKKEEINSTLLTRSQAMDMAKEMFNKGFDVDIDKEDVSEFVRLYKNGDSYLWNIMWSNKSKNKLYTCEINSKTREVNRIAVNLDKESEGTIYSEKLDMNTILDPLMKALGIDLSTYKRLNNNLQPGTRYQSDIYVKEGESNRYVLVDLQNNKPIEYYIINNNESEVAF